MTPSYEALRELVERKPKGPSKIPPKRRKTAYTSLKRIARKLGLRVTVKSPAALLRAKLQEKEK